MMVKLIKSRYGTNRLITEEADGSLIIEGETLYYRCSTIEKDNTTQMFDFEGGPFIMVGDPMLDIDMSGTVRSIEILDSEKGYAKIKVRYE
jgi:hypothetical protein